MLASTPRVSQTSETLSDVDQFQRIPFFAPGFDAAGQRPHPDHSFPEQLQRRPGAGGFVWSRTIEHYVLIARNLLLAAFKFVQVDPDRARQLLVIVFDL